MTEDYKNLKKSAELISTLTDYPEEVVRTVLYALRLVQLEDVADKAIDSDELPETMSLHIPGFGTVRAERLLNGRTSDLAWKFIPNNDFQNLFMKAYYEGKTPLMDIATYNFKDTLKFRSDNIIREVGEPDE